MNIDLSDSHAAKSRRRFNRNTLLYPLYFIPIIRCIIETQHTQTSVKFYNWLLQCVLRISSPAYWPVHHSSTVTWASRIRIGIETSPGMMHGCYIQGMGGIEIGNYTQIACNVGLISANHETHDSRFHSPAIKPSLVIGHYCWIGMNSTILPGVRLGDFTVIGAGSVVTRSFPLGYQVIAGNPAKVIRQIDPSLCHKFKSKHEYHGYIPSHRWTKFAKNFLENPSVLTPF